ncbi:uncharacterized protein BJ171DRAFT_277141 [Polychytrium aggregatum]|uniref:uncharacterized protein n=1 Tax=Polychytrium aggregatum TaxID=110093 RepID=UPI0022FE7090|nr:uncharacterized protein BJ171DRAFT_277141 [Polychytrium aggregatum]KAI9207532.1 hypothetical protein BJ171DRAFT_277141 [Polychytrium aggregatum]
MAAQLRVARKCAPPRISRTAPPRRRASPSAARGSLPERDVLCASTPFPVLPIPPYPSASVPLASPNAQRAIWPRSPSPQPFHMPRTSNGGSYEDEPHPRPSRLEERHSSCTSTHYSSASTCPAPCACPYGILSSLHIGSHSHALSPACVCSCLAHHDPLLSLGRHGPHLHILGIPRLCLPIQRLLFPPACGTAQGPRYPCSPLALAFVWNGDLFASLPSLCWAWAELFPSQFPFPSATRAN